MGYTGGVRRLSSWLFILALGTSLAYGRAGGGHSYSGGSHSSYSGGSHSSYSSGSGSSYSGRSRGPDLLSLYIVWVIANPIKGVPATLILLYMAYLLLNASNSQYTGHIILKGQRAETSLRLAEELAKLRARDPSFGPDLFRMRAEAAFLKIQEAWSAQDMKPARAFLSDGVMERFSIQLAMQVSAKLRNKMENVQVLESVLIHVQCEPQFDVVHVRIQAEADDSDVSLEDGRVVRAAEEDSPSFTEVWSFLRRPGAKTSGKDGLIEGFCPGCGAPLVLADAAQCDTCKIWVNSGEYDWVLSEITQECEWVTPQSGAQVPGLAALAETDPGLNVQFLEDRASVAFWRFQEALLEGQTGPLKSIATDGFCSGAGQGLAEGKLFYRNAAVGKVEVLALESGQPFDRAHVMVKWSGQEYEREGAKPGEQVVREHVFVLARKSGVLTDLKSGLRSLRCPGCGAPPSRRDAPRCEYCSAPFNDGSRGWTLSELVPSGRWQRPIVPDGSPRTLPVGLDWADGLSSADGLAVMVSAMYADGEVSPQERQFLGEYAGKRGIPDSMVNQLMEAATAGRLEAPKPKSAKEAEAMLRGLILMSLADGSVSSVEMKTLTLFAAKLSMPEGQVRTMVKEERDTLYRRAKEALAAAKSGGKLNGDNRQGQV